MAAKNEGDLEALKIAALASLKNKSRPSGTVSPVEDDGELALLRQAALLSRQRNGLKNPQSSKITVSHEENDSSQSDSGQSDSGQSDSEASEVSLLEEVEVGGSSDMGVPDLLCDSMDMTDLLEDELDTIESDSASNRTVLTTSRGSASRRKSVENSVKHKRSGDRTADRASTRRSADYHPSIPRSSEALHRTVTKRSDEHSVKPSRRREGERLGKTGDDALSRRKRKFIDDNPIDAKKVSVKLKLSSRKVQPTKSQSSEKEKRTVKDENALTQESMEPSDSKVKKSLKDRLGGYADDKVTSKRAPRRRVSLETADSPLPERGIENMITSMESSPPRKHKLVDNTLSTSKRVFRDKSSRSSSNSDMKSRRGSDTEKSLQPRLLSSGEEVAPGKHHMEKELDERIRKIQEKNARILARQQEIEREKALLS